MGLFHKNNCIDLFHKVIDPQNLDLSMARKKLCEATKIILINCLSILGISAPERM